MIGIFEYPYQVTAQDIDERGHAGNSRYVQWMQQAAIAHSAANGWGQRKYDELGAGWVVRSHQITYLKPAFLGDAVVIRTWVSNMKPATSLRRYEIFNAAGELLAKAETDWAFIDYARGKPVRIPDDVKNSFATVHD